MNTRSLTALVLCSLALVQPAFAQNQSGLTLAQVQQKYRTMNAVHIRKCDRDGNGLYSKSEMQCVAGIYQAMYLDR